MTEKVKQIHESIERTVAHLSRVHGVTQETIWSEMYLRAFKEVTLKQ